MVSVWRLGHGDIMLGKMNGDNGGDGDAAITSYCYVARHQTGYGLAFGDDVAIVVYHECLMALLPHCLLATLAIANTPYGIYHTPRLLVIEELVLEY